MNGVKKLLFLYVRFWTILLLSIVAGIALFVAGIYVACAIDPPHTPEGYGTEPIGQALLGILVGVLGGIFVFILLLRKNRHHFKD